MTNILGEDERQELERLRQMELEVLRKKDQDTDDPPVMYLVVRTDLKMSGPKIAVQVGHGVQLFMQMYFVLSSSRFLAGLPEPMNLDEGEGFTTDDLAMSSLVDVWFRTGYTKIILGASDDDFARVKQENEKHIPVVDLGRTEVAPNTETLVLFFPMRKSERPPTLKRLRLLEL